MIDNHSIKFPYDDDYMRYDYVCHRYYLTEKALFDELGINFGLVPSGMDSNPSTLAQRFIRKACDSVYRYLYKDTYNAKWLEFELAIIPDLRKVVKEMLLAQAEYNAENGDLAVLSGIDIYKGNHIPRDDLKKAIVSFVVDDLANTIQPCIGRPLKYAGVFGYIAPPYNDREGNPVY